MPEDLLAVAAQPLADAQRELPRELRPLDLLHLDMAHPTHRIAAILLQMQLVLALAAAVLGLCCALAMG